MRTYQKQGKTTFDCGTLMRLQDSHSTRSLATFFWPKWVLCDCYKGFMDDTMTTQYTKSPYYFLFN